MCNFDFTAGNLLLLSGTKGKMIVAPGEHMGDTMLMYYTPTAKTGHALRYKMPTEDTEEGAEFVEWMEQRPNECQINVIGLDLSKDVEPGKPSKKDVSLIEASSHADLLNAIMQRGIEEERLAHAYVFTYKGAQMIGAFDIIKELANEKRAFYYAKLGAKTDASFARRSFASNKIDFVNSAGDHAFVYVKLMHLAEPFPFM